MYLHISRRNPGSDWNPYGYNLWLIGRFTDQQLGWVKKFAFRTRRDILEDLALKWALNGCFAALALGIMHVSFAHATIAGGIAALIGFGIHQRFSLRAWEWAEACVRNRQLVARESDASWSAVRGAVVGRVLSRLEHYEVRALDDFFGNVEVIECDQLVRTRKLAWSDEKRIKADLATRVKALGKELRRRREYHQVMPKTRAELAAGAAPFDKVLAEEEQQVLRARVDLALNHPH